MEQRTSRGYALEMLEVMGNLLAATEHLHDIGQQTEEVVNLIWMTRSVRQKAFDVIAPIEEVDMDYHCYFKHILLAYIQAKEALQVAISENDKAKIEKHQELLDMVKDNLLDATIKYLKVEVDGEQCWKCVDDRLYAIKHEIN